MTADLDRRQARIDIALGTLMNQFGRAQLETARGDRPVAWLAREQVAFGELCVQSYAEQRDLLTERHAAGELDDAALADGLHAVQQNQQTAQRLVETGREGEQDSTVRVDADAARELAREGHRTQDAGQELFKRGQDLQSALQQAEVAGEPAPKTAQAIASDGVPDLTAAVAAGPATTKATAAAPAASSGTPTAERSGVER